MIIGRIFKATTKGPPMVDRRPMRHLVDVCGKGGFAAKLTLAKGDHKTAERLLTHILSEVPEVQAARPQRPVDRSLDGRHGRGLLSEEARRDIRSAEFVFHREGVVCFRLYPAAPARNAPRKGRRGPSRRPPLLPVQRSPYFASAA